MRKKFLLALMVMALTVSSDPVWAKDGFYMGMDLGVAIAPDMDVTTGGLDDWSSSVGSSGVECDRKIYPPPDRPAACSDSPRPWGPLEESFDGGAGILAGVSLGYRFMENFRVEGEYFYRGTSYDSTAVPRSASYNAATDSNFDIVQDAVDSVFSHNFFANLYYDFRSDSKFTPYVGIGVGLANVSVEYRTLWHRTTDIDSIDAKDREFASGPAGDALYQRLAGRLTTDSATLSDTLFGYQALAGLDYQVSDPVTIGLKFRWADFGEFEDESAYDRLRSHASVAGNPPVPVTYYVKTDDIQFWGVSLNMKYQF